jgi:hypothetical protein
MSRWDAVIGVVNVSILFVPIFLAILCSAFAIQNGREWRDRRIAEYKKSPDSRLLRLNH